MFRSLDVEDLERKRMLFSVPGGNGICMWETWQPAARLAASYHWLVSSLVETWRPVIIG